jgi:hypothetical protein
MLIIEFFSYIVLFNIFFILVNFLVDILCLINYFIFRIIESICKNFFKILLRRGIISIITVIFWKFAIDTNLYHNIICNYSTTEQLLLMVSSIFAVFLCWKANSIRILKFDYNEKLSYLKKRKEYLRAKAESLGLDKDLDNWKDRQDLINNQYFDYNTNIPFRHKCNEVEQLVWEEKTAEWLKRTIDYKINAMPSEFGFYVTVYLTIVGVSKILDYWNNRW